MYAFTNLKSLDAIFFFLVLGSNSLICMLVGTILNKHAHNFAEFFHAKNGSDFVGYSKIQDHVDDLGQHFRADVTSTTLPPELQTEAELLDDHHGDFHYPLTPVLATLTLLVGNQILKNQV